MQDGIEHQLPLLLSNLFQKEVLLLSDYDCDQVKRFISGGMDIHKKMISAAIAITDPNSLKTHYEFFHSSSFHFDLQKLYSWFSEFHCTDIVMESTGVYWFPVFDYFVDHGITITVVNPKYVKQLRGKKTDKNDSKWMASRFRYDDFPGSFIPKANIRALRSLSRYYRKLSNQRSSEKNRYQNAMTSSSIRLDCILADAVSGKTGRKLMEYLISLPQGADIDPHEIEMRLDWRVKSTPEQIIQSIQGFHIKPEDRIKLKKAQEHMDFIDELSADVLKSMDNLAADYSDTIRLLATVPGITEKSALFIISETGVDMSVFSNVKSLCCWAGLVPGCNESADKKKSTRIIHAGQYLKPVLVECALAAVKCKSEPYFRIKYARIAKRRGKKKAIIAVARMLLVAIYNIILKNEPFKPTDYEKVLHPSAKKKVVQTVANSIQYLREQGVDESLLQQIQQQLNPA